MTTDQIKALGDWSAPREVNTRRGAKLLSKMPASESFWTAWRASKMELAAAGVSCGKDARSGAWEACWWQDIPTEVKAARVESIEASRATDADIEIPVPDGMAYLPFQRAGICFALKKFGVLK